MHKKGNITLNHDTFTTVPAFCGVPACPRGDIHRKGAEWRRDTGDRVVLLPLSIVIVIPNKIFNKINQLYVVDYIEYFISI